MTSIVSPATDAQTGIAPDDPRHGRSAGYVAGCRESCCRTAIADYARNLRTRQYLNGGPLTVDGTGTRRRIQALMALGWSGPRIDEHLGKRRTYTVRILLDDGPVLLKTAEMVARTYDALSMTLPPSETRQERQVATRTRNYAKARGWVPPLAWNNIDDPTENPNVGRDDRAVDPVVVDRILAGDFSLSRTANTAERAEVVRRWRADGRSTNELERLTGWRPHRYLRNEEAA